MTKDPFMKKIPKLAQFMNGKLQNDRIDGHFVINRIRKYPNTTYGMNFDYYEVDVTFDGKIYGQHQIGGVMWVDSEIMQNKLVSKVRVNKTLKRHISRPLRKNLEILLCHIYPHDVVINKISWV